MLYQTDTLPADGPPPRAFNIRNSPPAGAAPRHAGCGHHHGACRGPTTTGQVAPRPSLVGAKSPWFAVVGHPAVEKTARIVSTFITSRRAADAGGSGRTAKSLWITVVSPCAPEGMLRNVSGFIRTGSRPARGKAGQAEKTCGMLWSPTSPAKELLRNVRFSQVPGTPSARPAPLEPDWSWFPAGPKSLAQGSQCSLPTRSRPRKSLSRSSSASSSRLNSRGLVFMVARPASTFRVPSRAWALAQPTT